MTIKTRPALQTSYLGLSGDVEEALSMPIERGLHVIDWAKNATVMVSPATWVSRPWGFTCVDRRPYNDLPR